MNRLQHIACGKGEAGARSSHPEQLSRIELARYLRRCERHSVEWRQAMAVWKARSQRISRVQRCAALSVLICAFLAAVIGLLGG